MDAEDDEPEEGLTAEVIAGRQRLGLHLRLLRKTIGLTQKQVQERCGVVQPVLSRIELGQRGLHLDTAIALAGAYHLSVDQVLGRAAAPEELAEIAKDPFPFRRELRLLPSYQALPERIRLRIERKERRTGDMASVWHWAREVERVLEDDADGGDSAEAAPDWPPLGRDGDADGQENAKADRRVKPSGKR